MKKYAIAIVAGFLSLVFALPAYAQESSAPFIAEINWAGSEKSSADEWIRLFNPSSENIDLGGWILTGAATGGGALELVSGTVLPPKADLLIANYAMGHENSILAEMPDLVTTALSLPNRSAQFLLSKPDGIVVDQVGYGTPSAGSTNPYTPMFRLQKTDDWQTGFWQGFVIEPPKEEPGTGEVAETELPSADPIEEENIVLEEILAQTDEPEVMPEAEIPPIADADSQLEAIASTVEVEEPEIIPEQNEEMITEVIQDELIEELPVESVVFDEPEVKSEESVEVNEVLTEETEVETIPVLDAEQEMASESPAITALAQTTVSPDPIPEPIPVIPSFAPLAVLLNEVMSAPKDGTEWIELFNPGPELIDLTDWTVMDESGKSTMLTGMISIGGYFTVENPLGKLNNDKDIVSLFDPSGNLIDRIAYGGDLKAPKSQMTIGRNTEGEWEATSEPTKGFANTFPIPAPITNDLTIAPYENQKSAENPPASSKQNAHPTQSSVLQNASGKPTANASDLSKTSAPVHHIVAVASKPKETVAKSATTAKKSPTTTKKTTTSTKKKASTGSAKTKTVNGTITVSPGVFGSQIAYIAGTELYLNSAAWPELKPGDVVTVTGTPSESVAGRVKIASADDIKILRFEDLRAIRTDIQGALDMPMGSLIQLLVKLEEKNGDTAVFSDDSGKMTAIATKQSGVSWKSLSGGDILLTGILREVNGEKRLYPRSPDDLSEEKEDGALAPLTLQTYAPTKTSSWPIVGAGLLASLLALIAYWFVRDRYPQFAS